MSGSKTIIAGEPRLDNVHPGDVLREDFLVGTDIWELTRATKIDANALTAMLEARRPVDAAVDARLTRYFGLSDGFFLRLQNRYDLEEVHRRDRDALDRITPRAA